MRRRVALPVTVSLALAATLTLVAATSGWLDAPVPGHGDDAGGTVVVPAVRDPGTGGARDGARDGAAERAPVVTTSSPVAVHVGALDVSAPLVPVGVLEGGVMEIPDDVATVGWYATAARRVSPGDPGTAVLAGHRDSRTQGAGALHDLGALTPGDVIEVIHLDGTVSAWQVDDVLLTPREALPVELLYATDGPPRLALVSCGGEFDRAAGSYTDNVIVVASPSGDAHARSR